MLLSCTYNSSGRLLTICRGQSNQDLNVPNINPSVKFGIITSAPKDIMKESDTLKLVKLLRVTDELGENKVKVEWAKNG